MWQAAGPRQRQAICQNSCIGQRQIISLPGNGVQRMRRVACQHNTGGSNPPAK
jgi:hypothetical protein